MNSTSLQEGNNSTNAVGHTGMVEVYFILCDRFQYEKLTKIYNNIITWLNSLGKNWKP